MQYVLESHDPGEMEWL